MSMSSTSKLITAFVLLIIGIVLTAQVAVIGLAITTAKTQSISNETVDISSAKIAEDNINESISFLLAQANTGWKTEPSECEISNSVVFINATTLGTENTDYTLSVDGSLVILNNSETIKVLDNSTLVSYYHCGDDYMDSSWGRTAIDLVPGFFAIALLLVSVGLFYSVAKEEGIIN